MMVKCNSWKPYWKEKFIDGLSSLFAHKVKDEFVNSHTRIIDYENLTYGDLFSTIKKTPYKMCIDKKMIRQQLKKLNMKWVISVNNLVYLPLLHLGEQRRNLINFLEKNLLHIILRKENLICLLKKLLIKNQNRKYY
jgi:hypothetical protein